VELQGRWWNQRWGNGRRDIWLYSLDGRWQVRAKEGGDRGRDLTWPPVEHEWEARALVDRLIAASPGGRTMWKDMIKLVRKPPPPPD
jgi:hypothetical protein